MRTPLLLISAFIISVFPVVAWAQFAGGDGSADNPYQIATETHLDNVRNFHDPGVYFEQVSDINISEGWTPITENGNLGFSGVYDGAGFEITGLSLSADNLSEPYGLFRANVGTIRNLTISDASASYEIAKDAALLVGFNRENGIIENVSISGVIQLIAQSLNNYSEEIGGIAGLNDGTIDGVQANVSISGYAGDNVGGIAGLNDTNGIIQDAQSTGQIRGLTSNDDTESDTIFGAGGIAGYNSGEIQRSSSSMNVQLAGLGRTAGGLAGTNAGLISQSFASGRVFAGGHEAGGLVGKHQGLDGVIEDSYAQGNVGTRARSETFDICDGPCADAGGLVGVMLSNNAFIYNSYASGRVLPGGGAQDSFGGLVGRIAGGPFDAIVEDSYWNIETSGMNGSAAGTGLTIAEMLQESAYQGFSFGSVWGIQEGASFAFLIENQQTPLPADPAVLDMSGPAGWRMLSMPVDAVTVGDLAAQNLVQGIDGANEFYEGTHGDVEFEDGVESNLLRFDPATYDAGDDNADGWEIPADMNDSFDSGLGFIWFMYDNSNGPSVPLDDFTLYMNGSPPQEDVSLSFSAADEWILAGNPFPADIDAAALDATGLASAAAQIWDAESGSFEVINFTAGEQISQWQGFFIENDTADEFIIPLSARLPGSSSRNSTKSEAQPATVTFTLEGTDDDSGASTTDRAISLLFHENATNNDWDKMDVRKRTPISDSYATLAFVGERDGEPIYKSQESRSAAVAGSYEIPMQLDLEAISGSFELSWETDQPDAYTELILTDQHTGEQIDLREADSYSFTATEASDTSKDDAAHRFMLSLNTTATDTEPGPDLPERVALHQNYPNPFNPVTQIEYELPASQDVRIEVFNVQGQRVATLVNGSQSAGTQQVSFDASSLSSGVYLYRLTTPEQTLTKKMLLVK